jgi:hypothetical protein
MAAPAQTKTGQRFYDATAPLAGHDEENGWPIALLTVGFAAMLDQVADLVSDTDDDVPGWVTRLFDIDNEPAGWLPITEAFLGVNPYPAVDEAGRRTRLKQTDGRRRGTPAAIKGAARQFLTGGQTVYLTQRVGAVATDYTVATLVSETPNSALVEAALVEQKPAGFNLTYTTITGGTFDTLRDTHVDFDDVDATFADFDAVRADPSIT